MFLKFHRVSKTGSDNVAIEIDRLVIAGWTGRNMDAIEHHIEELAALGIPRPSTTPLFYRVAAETFVRGNTLTVLGPDGSGEVEPVVAWYTDDVVYTDPNTRGEVRGRDALRRWVTKLHGIDQLRHGSANGRPVRTVEVAGLGDRRAQRGEPFGIA